MVTEERPEIFHRDNQKGRIDEMLELVKQAPAKNRGKTVVEVLGVRMSMGVVMGHLGYPSGKPVKY